MILSPSTALKDKEYHQDQAQGRVGSGSYDLISYFEIFWLFYVTEIWQ